MKEDEGRKLGFQGGERRGEKKALESDDRWHTYHSDRVTGGRQSVVKGKMQREERARRWSTRPFIKLLEISGLKRRGVRE